MLYTFQPISLVMFPSKLYYVIYIPAYSILYTYQPILYYIHTSLFYIIYIPAYSILYTYQPILYYIHTSLFYIIYIPAYSILYTYQPIPHGLIDSLFLLNATCLPLTITSPIHPEK